MTRPLRILFADDDPDIRFVIESSLEDEVGMEVLICASGASAIEAAPAFRPDLIVLDVMMPGENGPAVLARMRGLESTRTTPAVFLTARVQTSEVEQLRALGAIGVIAKPFDPMRIADELRVIWSTSGESLSDGS